MMLALQKLFVLIAGGGAGLALFGLIWRGGDERARRYSLNRRFFQESSRDIRYGTMLVLVGLLGYGLARFL